MYPTDAPLNDSPLSISSMFRRQAAAMGITATPRQCLAPLAPIVHGATIPDTADSTVAGFVHEATPSEHCVSADKKRL